MSEEEYIWNDEDLSKDEEEQFEELKKDPYCLYVVISREERISLYKP